MLWTSRILPGRQFVEGKRLPVTENSFEPKSVLLRLEDERSASKIEAVRRLLEHYSDQLTGNFVVVTKTTVRFAYKK